MTELKCPKCEKRMEAGVSACPNCGLSSKSFVELYSDIYSRPEGKKPRAQISDTFIEYCVQCGLGSKSQSNAFCSGCGNSLEAQRIQSSDASSFVDSKNLLGQSGQTRYKVKSIFILIGIFVLTFLVVGIVFSNGGSEISGTDASQTIASDPIRSDTVNSLAPTPERQSGHWEQNCISVQVTNPNFNPYRGISPYNAPTNTEQQCSQAYVKNP